MQRRAKAVAGPLSSFIPDSQFTTVILLAINFGLFVAALVLSNKMTGNGGGFSINDGILEYFGSKHRLLIIVNGQWWRLVTAGFLHGDMMHILMNSWALFSLGAQLESIVGTARYLVIYLVSSVGGFYLSFLLSPAPSVGSSAAIAGLIGATMAYAKRTNQSMLWAFYMRWVIILGLIGMWPGLRVDNWAHLGGILTGGAIGWFAASPHVNRDIETLWKSAATVCCLVTAAALAFAYWRVIQAL